MNGYKIVLLKAIFMLYRLPECERVCSGICKKDDSFKGSIGNIYQTYNGEDVYPTLEEKAANLLYFINKNHSFSDGNKRIAATIFLYFLYKNGVLYDGDGNKKLSDYTLAVLTIMVAESRVEEKEMMVTIIMNCI